MPPRMKRLPLKQPRPPEVLYAGTSLSGTSLRGAKIAPDGTFVTVLQGREDDANQQDLWAYDFESGEGRLLVSSAVNMAQELCPMIGWGTIFCYFLWAEIFIFMT